MRHHGAFGQGYDWCWQDVRDGAAVKRARHASAALSRRVLLGEQVMRRSSSSTRARLERASARLARLETLAGRHTIELFSNDELADAFGFTGGTSEDRCATCARVRAGCARSAATRRREHAGRQLESSFTPGSSTGRRGFFSMDLARSRGRHWPGGSRTARICPFKILRTCDGSKLVLLRESDSMLAGARENKDRPGLRRCARSAHITPARRRAKTTTSRSSPLAGETTPAREIAARTRKMADRDRVLH